MWKIVLVSAMAVGAARGGFFDLTDVEDPLALLWNLPIQQKLSKCKIDEHRNGMCMDKAKCLLTGGTPTGHCGFVFTCCSYDTDCVKTSDKKQSYFNSGNLNSAVTSCKYTVKLKNKNVCQVRLDFEQLTLAPSILTSSSTDAQSIKIFTCANDALRINPSTYGVPVLCGNNTAQHLYIHVNQSTDPQSAVHIDINLANRLNELNKYLPTPSWKIKFTQLECPLKKHVLDLSKFGEAENINKDFIALAPQGAIQYFTDMIGEFRSFGYNESKALQAVESTSYPYLEHYTIAFRRPTEVCGIRFNPSHLNLLNSDDGETCNHYLYVPEYYSESSDNLGTDKTKVCTDQNYFYSLVPGPFYLNFKAMETTVNTKQDANSNQGFVIDYELLTTCPYNNN